MVEGIERCGGKLWDIVCIQTMTHHSDNSHPRLEMAASALGFAVQPGNPSQV
jgi:hypothetical protein